MNAVVLRCSQGQEKKRTFDDFFNFCSFVLAYEEQLVREREPSAPFFSTADVLVHVENTMFM